MLAAMLAAPGAVSAAATPPENFGFARPINPKWFPDDPRQWSGYARSAFVTDLSRVADGNAVTTGRREKGKWKVLPFEAGNLKGQALSCYAFTGAPRVSLPLGRTGWHAVYVGLSTVSGGIEKAQSSGLQARLGSSPVFRRMKNNLKLAPKRRDVVQEQFLAIAELKDGETIEFAPLPHTAATVMYVRLVPLTEAERRAWAQDAADKTRRNNVATFDGHSWIWPYQPKTEADLLGTFEGLQTTDFGQWWFGVVGADLVNYPTKVGTVLGRLSQDYPTREHEAFATSLEELLQRGVNPLLVARHAARRQGRAFHVFLRPAAWGASIPFEETFESRFFREHPEWRAVDREGKRTLHLSWAVPEVRRQTLAIFRETVEMADPEGVGLFFNRGMPLMLWEEAFARRFRVEHGIEILQVEAEDPRIHRLRGRIMTEYFRELRALLDELGAQRGGKRYAISVAAFADKKYNERFGLDVETWVKERLVDQVSILVAYHTDSYAPPNLAYYRSVVEGTGVKLFPFVVAWRTTLWNEGKPADFCRLIRRWQEQGVDGIGVWDPAIEKGYGQEASEGQPIDVLAYLGHRELIAHWAEHGVPLPPSRPVTRLGENEYSTWFPNTGY
jgi:hypothetical protein